MLRKKIIGLLLLATGWTACTQNFDEINTDPNWKKSTLRL